MKFLLPLLASVLSLSILGVVQRKAINAFLMGVFRDLGRIKARKRRMAHNTKAVTSNWDILFRRDDPLEGIDFEKEQGEGNAHGKTSYTLAELAEYGDGMEGRPILLSIFGRVYDVTSGAKFYGPEGSYSMFAGRDVTKALSTGCKAEECITRDTTGLTEKQLTEGKRWLSFFQMHDKYSYVGNLEGDTEAWLDILVETGMKENDTAQGKAAQKGGEGETVEL